MPMNLNPPLARLPLGFAMFLLLAVAAAPVLAQSASDVGDTAKTIVTAPLRDTNVVKTDIPPLLLASSKAPYSLAGLRSCGQFQAAIGALTKVLGPDVDEVKPKEGQTAGELALGLTEDVATGFIPFRGIIRRLSGADAHERKVRAAIYSGGLRRAYLKGTARARGCKL